MPNFYTLLGCEENASFEEIKRRYQELARKCHPDKSSSTSDDKGEYFIQITEAWQTLRDPASRKAYDAQLLAEQCQSEHVLYATITWSEMDFDQDIYTYPCRCGASYCIPKDEANLKSDLFCPCSECSLGILIKS